MKTLHIITLLLNKLCNQRNSCFQKKQQVSLSKMNGLIFMFILLFSTQTFAITFDTKKLTHLNVIQPTGNDSYDNLQFSIMVLNQSNTDDGMRDFNLYIVEDNGTETLILNMNNKDCIHDGIALDAFTPVNSYTTGFINNTKNLVKLNSITNINFSWSFPQRLISKTFKLRMRFIWDINLDNKGDLETMYTNEITTPKYIPTTPTLSFTPTTLSNLTFGWTGANTTMLTRMIIYSDNLCTKKIDSVDVAIPPTAAGTYISKIAVPDLSKEFKYYVKQIYIQNSPISGSIAKRYESAAITVTNTGYKSITALTGNYIAAEQKINLNWAASNTNGSDVRYHIKRDGVFITASGGQTGLMFDDFTTSTIKNWSTYNYTVIAVPTGCSKDYPFPGMSAPCTVKTSPTFPSQADFDFKLVAHPTVGLIKPYMTLSWDPSKWVSQNVVKLYHKSSTDADFSLVGIMTPDSKTYNDISSYIVDNSQHSYYLEVTIFDNSHIYKSQTESGSVENTVAFKSFKASKNTIGDRIQLTWEIDRLDLCDRFEIYRSYIKDSTGINSTPELIQQLSAQTVYNTFDDMTATAGVINTYNIKAYKTGADKIKRTTSSPKDIIGFRMPVGTVTGRITYGGGTAVGGVSLYVNSSKLDDNMLYKSIEFKGTNSQKGAVALTKLQHGCDSTGFTFQTWLLSTRPKLYTPIFEVNKEYSIGIQNDSVLLYIGYTDYSTPKLVLDLESSKIAANTYFHLSASLGSNDSIKLYINGQLKKTGKLTQKRTCLFIDEVLDSSTGDVKTARTKSYIANTTDATQVNVSPYNGKIDDVRLWSMALANNVIAENYNHYLGGNETGLIGYWPLDEGVNRNAFDCSKTDNKPNEHHIDFTSAYTSTIVPIQSQLSIKGITDNDGNYIIRGIPFSGTGSTYSIQPIKGTHKFEPTQLVRYISPSSLVHNSSDYTDKSSFPVKIKVKYSNTNYPVTGVMFYVDENPCSIENKLVTTASQLTTDNTRTDEFKTIDVGECVIDVPIGEHYIRAELAGHSFENKGRWPAIGKQIFNENSVKVIEFADTSLVTVVGRVVGGAVENSYPIGFKNSDNLRNHNSHANIGKALIIMEPSVLKTYRLNDTDFNISQTLSASEAIKFGNVATFKKLSSQVHIMTDPETGEYMVKLPPIQWDIMSVNTASDAQYSNWTSIIPNIQSFNTSTLISAFDTAKIIETNKVDTFKYNVKKSFTHTAPTVIEVRDAYTGSVAYGESEWHVTSPGETEVVRPLYTIGTSTAPKTVDYTYGKTPANPMGKPIFAQGKTYALKISAFESYTHPEGLTSMIQYAKVPHKGDTITVTNEIGILVKKIIPDASDPIATHVMKLDNNGQINYIFKAGFPNLADINSGLSMNISLSNGTGKPIVWNEMGNFRGIVAGCEPIAGTNFVTKGPVYPLVVLRDPPGSNSYAYMETGTTLSYSFVDKSVINGNNSGSITMKIGPEIETAVGLGFMVMADVKSVSDTKIGLEGETSSFTGKTGTKTLTTKERIQTSASPDFVGSNADVYIGISTNTYYCESKELNIQKNGLEINTINTGSIGGDTEFRFSQNEIVTAQIPKWKQILREQLVTVLADNLTSAKNDYQTLANDNKKNYYLTTSSPSNPNFGMLKSYTIIRPTTKTNLPDTIETIVTTIASWENTISKNEEQKRKATSNTDYVKTNISFDAGVSVERAYTYTDNKGTTSGATDKTMAVLGSSTGFTLNGIGFQGDLETKIGGGTDNQNNSSTENTTTFGYVLSDPDADNRFAVNVYKNKFLDTSESNLPNFTDRYVESSLGSYIFEIAGGQSSCPNEVADLSLYYKENNKEVQLANGTTPLDAPYINIPSYTKTDIPNGKDATFSLELGNKSIIQTPRAYMLSVDDKSNPYGAVVSVDGTPLTVGRIFYVTPGQTLEKTLTFHQTRLDVLDYKNIKLKFSSICDIITKTQNINVTYVPSCSDLEIALDRQIINTENPDPLNVTFKNFNQEYASFLGLQLEYKLDGDTKWTSKVFAKDKSAETSLKTVNISNDMLIPIGVNGLTSTFDYKLSFDGLIDGNYKVRAKTLCSNGTQPPINNITSEFSVIKDLVRPMAMGVPSPVNGILTPETEVSVTFNENIQTSKLIPGNFEVKGVLNGVPLQHAEGLSLDGTAKSQAFTESLISLQNGSFSIEGWVRTATDCSNYGNLFTIGTGSDMVSLYMKKDGMDLRVNDVSVSSNTITAKSDWQYVSMAYDIISQTITVNLLTSSSTELVISKKLTLPVNPVGRLFVGTGFKGNIHQVAVWSEFRTMSDLSDMNTTKTGTESNLIAYWPMDEASGTIAADKANSRNMTINSSWFIDPNGKSTIYNGENQSTIIKPTYNQFTSNDNFSLEFWFKGKSQANATMFSCGKGDTDLKPMEKLSVGFNSKKELCLNSKAISYVIPNAFVIDTVWHHFALSVLRGGNTNVYVDGLQKLQLSSSKIGGMSSDQISLGSRTYTDSTLVSGKYTYKTTQDQYFIGALDEVRIWKSSLTSENIKLDMHSRLTGTEAGLIAYYPFETPATGGITTFSKKDFSVTNAVDAESTALESVNTPGIKIPRAKEDVSYSYTASDNKIIFIIDASYAKTENCNLEFAVKTVYDLNGNMLKSPIKWTAFVNNNRLNWETETVSITKQVLEAASFKATIVNKSGKYENYIIDGLPSWLSVDKSSGRLNPLEKTELTFTVDQATNIGSYETRVTLTGNNGIKEMLPVSLKVTGPRPDWTVNPYGSETSMNVVGQIKIGGVYQEDKEDILAAFMGTRCVGLASPQFDKINNGYYLYMDIYGNEADNNQVLTYSLWDAGTGRIYPGVDKDASLGSFTAGAMIGTLSEPITFNATDKVEQQLSLKQGWNWLSTNVVSTTPSLIDQLKVGVGTIGEQLKSRIDGYIDYSNGGWYGSLQSLNQKSMYMLKTNEAKTLKMVGAMAKPADFRITINKGWSWIGYVPSFVAPLKEALSGLTPNTGDQIKGQVGFASYSGTAWYGSLQYMMPGLGYMYNSKDTTSFKYPAQYLSLSKINSESNETVNMKWPVDANKYQMSMTVTGVAAINSSEVANADMQLGVFVGDECRGTVVLKYVDTYKRYMAFLMVWGNMDDVNKKITFRSYDPTNSQELIAVDQSLSFVPDNITGSPASPYRISFITSGNAQVDMNKLKVYPNPVTDMLHFDYNPSGIQQLEVVDNMGRILFNDTHVMKNSMNVGNLVPGVYTLRIKYNGNLSNHLFIRK